MSSAAQLNYYDITSAFFVAADERPEPPLAVETVTTSRTAGWPTGDLTQSALGSVFDIWGDSVPAAVTWRSFQDADGRSSLDVTVRGRGEEYTLTQGQLYEGTRRIADDPGSGTLHNPVVAALLASVEARHAVGEASNDHVLRAAAAIDRIVNPTDIDTGNEVVLPASGPSPPGPTRSTGGTRRHGTGTPPGPTRSISRTPRRGTGTPRGPTPVIGRIRGTRRPGIHRRGTPPTGSMPT